MKRRTAIKTIGLGMGATVSFGAFISTIQSCVSEKEASTGGWQADYFRDLDQQNLIIELSDIILPTTDTPGAKDVEVIKYIDATVAHIYEPEAKERFGKGMAACIQSLEAENGGKFSELEREQLSAFLEKHMGKSVDPAVHKANRELIAQENPPTDDKKRQAYYLLNFLNSLKSLTIAGFYGSEVIGKEYLTYDPIPGPYQGCIDQEGINAYSL
jgi:hypothetical protein